ncbi:MAG: hypothetical protein Q8O67_24385 [Deltaproteobacteria bacterium]|nr:hypothetical protein [Deltaproteobacteria bacterium]
MPLLEHRALLENAGRDLWQIEALPPLAPFANTEVLAFCGRSYPLYRVEWTDLKKKHQVRCCFTFDQYVRALEERLAFEKTLEESAHLAKVRDALRDVQAADQPRPRWRGEQPLLSRRTWAAFQARHVVELPVRLFVYFKAPALVFHPRCLVINPCLKDYNLVSQLPPHQAWQDLSMYLGNTLVDLCSTPPRPITDEQRAETHGFDRRSFRTAKGGREKSNRGDW